MNSCSNQYNWFSVLNWSVLLRKKALVKDVFFFFFCICILAGDCEQMNWSFFRRLSQNFSMIVDLCIILIGVQRVKEAYLLLELVGIAEGKLDC